MIMMVLHTIWKNILVYNKWRINDKTTPFTDYNYVCCSTCGRPRSKGFHNRYYNALLKENDLPKIGFHDLRHTYATLLLINNYDLKAVSQLLGHASTIITSNVYFDKNRVIIDCLDELNLYIDKVKPANDNKENNSSIDENLDTNLMINKFI